MPGVVYQDYPDARLIVLWGVNPSASGIHLVPYVREAQAPARSSSSSIRDAPSLAQEGRPASGGPARHRPAGRARAPPRSCSRTGTPTRRSSRRTRDGAERPARPRRSRGRIERAAAEAGDRPAGAAAARRSVRATSPALIRCGWGLERNRNGGNAAAAVLALPAVGGKFGVRGGGYSMSNSLGVRHQARRPGSTRRSPRRGSST